MQAALSRQQLEERECSRDVVTHENLCCQSAEMLQTLLIPCSRQGRFYGVPASTPSTVFGELGKRTMRSFPFRIGDRTAVAVIVNILIGH